MSLNTTKVVVLAAGQGTRLRPLTNKKPKVLVKFNKKSIIDYQIGAYYKNNINDIHVIAGYRHEMINYPELKKVVNENYTNTNMVASLHEAKDLFDGKSNIIVSYGDIIFQRDLVEKLISDCGSEISIIYDVNWLKLWSQRMDNPLSDVESFKINEDNYVIELGRKPKDLEKIQGQYIGLIYINKGYAKQFFKLYEQLLKSGELIEGKNVPNIYMTTYLQLLIDSGVKVRGIPVYGGWLEIDSVDDLNIYHKMLDCGELKSIIDLKKI